MKIHFRQIYIEAGIAFPFTHHFQIFMSEMISSKINSSDLFDQEYGKDWEITVNISAKSNLSEIEIRGPAVYKKDKEVEHTLFLPFSKIHSSVSPVEFAISHIFSGTVQILELLNIDTSIVLKNKESIIQSTYQLPNLVKQDFGT